MGLALPPRTDGVPVNPAGKHHQHHHHKEQPQGSNQQGVVFCLQGSEQEDVADELHCGKEQAPLEPAEDGGGVKEGEEAHRGTAYPVGQPEFKVLGNGQQQQVEHHVSQTDETVLDGMNPHPGKNLEDEDGQKRDDQEEHRIFDAAGSLLVVVHRGDKADRHIFRPRPAHGVVLVILRHNPHLRIGGGKAGNGPGGGESLLAKLPIRGKPSATESGGAPGGLHGKIVVGGHGHDGNALPSLNSCIYLIRKAIAGKISRKVIIEGVVEWRSHWLRKGLLQGGAIDCHHRQGGEALLVGNAKKQHCLIPVNGILVNFQMLIGRGRKIPGKRCRAIKYRHIEYSPGEILRINLGGEIHSLGYREQIPCGGLLLHLLPVV